MYNGCELAPYEDVALNILKAENIAIFIQKGDNGVKDGSQMEVRECSAPAGKLLFLTFAFEAEKMFRYKFAPLSAERGWSE